MTVTPASVTLAPGETTLLSATVLSPTGSVLQRTVTWSSAAPAVAEVDQDGVVTALREGVAEVLASAGPRSGSAVVVVEEPPSDPLPPVVTTEELPRGVTGEAYQARLEAIRGDGTYDWSVTAGALPAGLTLASDGEISGTPTRPETSTFTVQVESAELTGTAELTIEVVGPPTVTTAALPDGGVGAAYRVTLEAEGGDGTFVWSLASGRLPAGLGLSTAGVLSGTPTEAGASEFTVRVRSAGLQGSADFSLTVHEVLEVTTADLPNAVVGEPYDVRLRTGGGDGSGTWSVTEGAPPAGLALDPDGRLHGTPTGGEPAEASGLVGPAPERAASREASSAGETGTGAGGSELAATTVFFTVRVVNEIGQEASRELSLTVNDDLVIATVELPDAEVGVPYEVGLEAEGGTEDRVWSVVDGGLPAGLEFDPSTGVIAGTPTGTGTSQLTLRVESGDGQSATAELTLTVVPGPVTVTTTSLPDGHVGEAYSATLEAEGGDGADHHWAVTVGDLPDGLALDPESGEIAGVPTAEGAFPITVEATSGGRSGEADLSITVRPARLRLERVAPDFDGFGQPVFLTAPDGDARLFVVDQPGRIWIVEDDRVNPTPFLDIRDRVGFGGERGLLGLAFHPDYGANGRFFVSFTDNAGDSRIEEFTVSADPDAASPAPDELIFELEQPFSNHNGGQIAFGPDGMFYVGLGDGGSAGDPLDNGQDPFTFFGTLLRIDVDSGDPYGIPPSNPFDGTDGLEEIWAWGLRNPWRWAFDATHGVLVIADVGQNEWEEVNVQPMGTGGINYGWSVLEASTCFESAGCDRTGLTEPDFEYSHADGCSVTGGFVYRGALAPSLEGRYVVSDFCDGWFRALDLAGSSVTGVELLDVGFVGNVTSFGVDAAGELYVLTLDGGVYRFVEGLAGAPTRRRIP